MPRVKHLVDNGVYRVRDVSEEEAEPRPPETTVQGREEMVGDEVASSTY
jgi:hypothetical protein